MRVVVLGIAVLFAAACSATEPFSLSASAPFGYQQSQDVSVERIAVTVLITNRTDDDLLVNPADFVLRDREGRIYTPNVPAGTADVRAVRQAGERLGFAGLLPLPSATLRKNDALVGFVVFEVPAGTRPPELIFRQTDTDRVVQLSDSIPEQR